MEIKEREGESWLALCGSTACLEMMMHASFFIFFPSCILPSSLERERRGWRLIRERKVSTGIGKDEEWRGWEGTAQDDFVKTKQQKTLVWRRDFVCVWKIPKSFSLPAPPFFWHISQKKSLVTTSEIYLNNFFSPFSFRENADSRLKKRRRKT